MVTTARNGHGASVPSFIIIGQMCSGKGLYADTLRTVLERELGISVYRVPPASKKVAEVARDIFGIENEANGKPNRTVLQAIGQKMYEIDPAVWIKPLIRDIKAGGHIPFIAEGLRHKSDLQTFRDTFSQVFVIKVETDEKQRIEVYKNVYGEYPTRQQLEHPSEIEISEMVADRCFHNDFENDTLAMQVREVVTDVKSGVIADLLRRGQ